LAVTASLLTFHPANRAGLQGLPACEIPTDRGRSGSNLLDFASPRAPFGAPVHCPSAWPRPSAAPSAHRPLTPPRCRHPRVHPLPEGASTFLRPTAATRSVPFRPRGFSPPRRLAPHSVCGLVASRCQPGFAGSVTPIVVAEATTQHAPVPRRTRRSSSRHRAPESTRCRDSALLTPVRNPPAEAGLSRPPPKRPKSPG
jgi:hypothetical protein